MAGCQLLATPPPPKLDNVILAWSLSDHVSQMDLSIQILQSMVNNLEEENHAQQLKRRQQQWLDEQKNKKEATSHEKKVNYFTIFL